MTKIQLVYEMSPDDLTYQDLKKEYNRLLNENARLHKKEREIFSILLATLETAKKSCWSATTPEKAFEQSYNLIRAHMSLLVGTQPLKVITKEAWEDFKSRAERYKRLSENAS